MILKVEGLHSGYLKVPVLRDLEIEIGERETVAVIGPNGAGKSTLLKTLMGLVRATSGKIFFEGTDISHLSTDLITKKGISLVPEGGRPFPNMSVYENLIMGAYGNREILKSPVIDEMYEIFPILSERRDQYARTLSGGERQMLCLARGLISRPKILMLDEPSLGLAPKLVDEIYEKIKVLREGFGLTVLLIEQNTSYALELASRAYVLENGQIRMHGMAEELRTSEHIRRHYLGI
jgi:branched-chain amino acid transport system ATP-binding protein